MVQKAEDNEVDTDDIDENLDNATRKLNFEPKKGPKSKVKSSKKKSKKDQDKESDEQFLATVNECMSSISDNMSRGKHEFIDTHQQWADLLASKCRRMEPVACERFKLEVDSKALDLIIEFDN